MKDAPLIARLRELVAGEDPKNPLTDQELSEALNLSLIHILSTFAFDIFLGTVVGVSNAMVENLGLTMTVVDFGSGVTPIILSNPVVVWAIPVGIALNIVMLLLKLTKTMDVDIYNMLYFWGTAGVLVYVSTGNFFFAILAIIITGVLTLKIADWTAPHIHKVLPQYTGLSFPYVLSLIHI